MGIEIRSRTLVALAAAVDQFELLEIMVRTHPDIVARYVRTNNSQAMAKELFSLPDNGS
jgi:hypothetical protein